MEIVPLAYNAHLGLDDDDERYAKWADANDEKWTECCDESVVRLVVCSRVGRVAIAVLTMFLIYIISLAVSFVPPPTMTDAIDSGPHPGMNSARGKQLLADLCTAFDEGLVSGDMCNRLCFSREWEIHDFYEGHKAVVIVKDGGQLTVLKSAKPSLDNYVKLPSSVSNDQFSDMVLDLVNDQLKLGWPREFKKHLMETLWPTLLRTPGEHMSATDRSSLWNLLQEPEFVIFRVLPLTRVTPKLIGTCGSFYQTESLVAFKMKSYYMNLKHKILVHIMGTLKLLYEFLNEPLQWCDVRFENLGLSADYPKRFILMDADNVYTESRLTTLLKGKPCASDADCTIGDCTARCTESMTCSARSNSNLEVFCDKLVKQLYGRTWSKNNRYLAACNDNSANVTQRLLDLRLTWSWNLPDV